MQTNLTFHTDFVTLESFISVKEALAILRRSQARVLIVQERGVPVGICDSQTLLLQTQKMTSPLSCSTEFKIINEHMILSEGDLHVPYFLIQNEAGKIMGWLDSATAEIEYLQRKLNVNDLTKELEAIVDSIYEEILVVDAKGTILRVSSRGTHNLWGVNPETVIGENMLELEQRGWFKPCVTRKVIEEQKKISVVQENRAGRIILAVGNPIFNRKKQLERIVIASRDITDQVQLEGERKDAPGMNQAVFGKHIISQSDRMKQLMTEVERVAAAESTVIIYGESGVGKELIASAIHHYSLRAAGPFVKINCGSIPETLLESELFGYEKGAFTGALNQGKMGLFELADTGTLFLDEVAELPFYLQAKLLRVIQEREIRKVGGTKEIPINVRILAATNKDLETLVAKGTFREDLYYRLHVIPFHVPALRERIEDVEPLVAYFLAYFNQKFGSHKHFSEDAIEMLKAYRWPGNVRQLQNVIERAMVVTNGTQITANELFTFLSLPI
jgi:PAS domain S-box-containing protein